MVSYRTLIWSLRQFTCYRQMQGRHPRGTKACYAEISQALRQSYICCILLVVRVSKGRVLVNLLMGKATRRGCLTASSSSLQSAQHAGTGSCSGPGVIVFDSPVPGFKLELGCSSSTFPLPSGWPPTPRRGISTHPRPTNERRSRNLTTGIDSEIPAPSVEFRISVT